MKKIFSIGLLILTTACNLKFSTPQATATSTMNAPATPTEFSTPAPTLTPTPVFTPTPVPLHFTEEFNADLGAWQTFQTGGTQPATASLANDALNLQLPSPNTWYYAIHTAHEYQGVYVSAKVSGTPAGSLGLVCDYSETEGWYEFNITHEGNISVLYGHWLAEGVAEYEPILNAASEYLQPGNLSYEIGLTCANETLYLHINGKMFKKIDEIRFKLLKGKVGLTASSFDNVPMNATFDWFKVGEPEW